MPVLPRPQKILLPILREKFPDLVFTTWIPDIDYRKYPLVNLRNLGGIRHPEHPLELANPVIEITVIGDVDMIHTENIYLDVLEAIYEAQQNQTQTDHGYIHSVFETMGMTQFSSEFQATWRAQGLVKVGIRPPRN